MINFKKRRSPLMIIGLLLILAAAFIFLACPNDPDPDPSPKPTAKSAVDIKAVPGIPGVRYVGDTTPKTLDNAQYTGTIAWNPNHDTFQASTQYVATIVLKPKGTFTFDNVALTGWTVAGGVPCTGVKNSDDSITLTSSQMTAQPRPVGPTEPTAHVHRFGVNPATGKDFDWHMDPENVLSATKNGREFQVCDGVDDAAISGTTHENRPLHVYRTLYATGTVGIEFVPVNYSVNESTGVITVTEVTPNATHSNYTAYGVKAATAFTATSLHIPAYYNSTGGSYSSYGIGGANEIIGTADEFNEGAYKPVVHIMNNGFKDKGNITDLTFSAENQLRGIGQNAFQSIKLSDTVKLEIPERVVFIGANAFDVTDVASVDRKLNYVSIPSTVRLIETEVFRFNPLETVIIAMPTIKDNLFEDFDTISTLTLMDGVASIGKEAFSGCSVLTKLTIPKSVKFIGVDAFKGSGITDLTINADRQANGTDSVMGTIFAAKTTIKTLTIGDDVTLIPAGAFSGCTAIATLTIGRNVATIGADAFKDTVIADLTVFKASLDGDFFTTKPYKDTLTTLTLGQGVVTIGKGAFEDCKKLITLNFGIVEGGTPVITRPLTTLTTIGEDAFRGSFGTGETAPTVAIKNVAYSNTSELPPSLTTIGPYAFGIPLNGANTDKNFISSITIPASVTSVGNYAFSGIPATSMIFIKGGLATEAAVNQKWGGSPTSNSWKNGYTGGITLIQ